MSTASKARQYHTQQIHFFRTLINFSDPDVAARKLGTLPAGANVLRVNTVISTAFNAGTTNTISVGYSSGGSDLVSAGAAGSATANTVTQAPSGKALLAADTDLWAGVTLSGTAATAGVAEVIVEYAPAI